MKCERCGKDFQEKSFEVCDNCGYDVSEGLRIKKALHEKIDDGQRHKTDLIDFPILSFIFGIVGMLLPIVIFSVLAIVFGKKPAKSNLIPLSHIGEVFGYLGLAVSVVFVFCFFLWLL